MGEMTLWQFALLQEFRYYNCLEMEFYNTDYLENRKV